MHFDLEEYNAQTRKLIEEALAMTDALGITYSVFGEDYNLRAMIRSEVLRYFVTQHPPRNYPPPFSLIIHQIPTEIKSELEKDITQKVNEILDYSQKCEGLSVAVPEGYLSENNFVDIARIYLTHLFGKQESRKLLTELSQQMRFPNDLNHRINVAKEVRTELVLASHILRTAIFQEKLFYFDIAPMDPSLQRTPQFTRLKEILYFTGEPEDCLVDVATPSGGAFQLLVPFLSGAGMQRMVVKADLRERLISGERQPDHIKDYYQCHRIN